MNTNMITSTKIQLNPAKSPSSQITSEWKGLKADFNSGPGLGKLFMVGLEVGWIGVVVQS